ncbi:MAG: aminotransferase class I/II-fold pyridoxal phosphate-dependent enzyme [Planctomycetaceae bacterium]
MIDGPSDHLSERIAAAWAPENAGRLLHLLASRMQEHFDSVMHSQERVLNWHHPQENISAATAQLQAGNNLPGALEGTDLEQRFLSLMNDILSHGQNIHDPRYIGHQVPASSPVAAMFDALGTLTNQAMAIYEMGPWGTAVERALVDELGSLFGWNRGDFGGLMTHGGSLANLTAMLTARNVVFPQSWERGFGKNADGTSALTPVLLVHADVHYCLTRAAGMLGLGTNNVIRLPLDADRRIDVAALDDILRDLQERGQPVLAVCACACSTPTGVFDRLHDIADLCQRYGVWFHVDAAHGGPLIFSDRYRHLLSGIERADSFVCDAHKMMFVPALCAFVFYRKREHLFAAFQQEAPYLFDPSQPEDTSMYDGGRMSVECTKRSAFGLWGLWSLFGINLFRDLIDRVCGLAERFYHRLSAAEDFLPLHEPECNIVCFRYIPESMREMSLEDLGQFNRDVRRELIHSGEFYIVQTTLAGNGTLRVAVMNPLTSETHLDALMQAIREAGDRVLQRRSIAPALVIG